MYSLPVLTLTESDVRALLTMEELLPAMEQALIAFSRGEVTQPVRSVVSIPTHHGRLGLMPAVWGDTMGIKLVTVYEQNAARGLPTHHAIIQLFSAVTGEPLAVMDGRLITEMRTAAVSAVATRLLTRPDVRSLAVLGSGVQARSHVRALAQVRNFADVRIWSRTAQHAQRVAEECGGRAASLEDAIDGADVVVCAASSPNPLIRGEMLKRDAFMNAISAVGLHQREMDDATLRDAAVIVESRDAAQKESADIVETGAAVHAELGELLTGTKPLPSRDQRIVYKGLGIAIEDLAAAMLVYGKAQG